VQNLTRPILLTLFLCLASLASAQSEDQPVLVESGRSVSLQYKLSTAEGDVVHSNLGEEPLVFVVGDGRMLPALEQALVGMSVGQSKNVQLSADQAYGPPNPDLVQTMPLSAVPEDLRVVGARLIARSPEGERRLVEVKRINGEEAVIDFNHPLAGQAIQFDVSIVAVE
jgi:peptidylprolyl isomerase